VGGGLLAGMAITVKERLPPAKVIAAEPSGADYARRPLSVFVEAFV